MCLGCCEARVAVFANFSLKQGCNSLLGAGGSRPVRTVLGPGCSCLARWLVPVPAKEPGQDQARRWFCFPPLNFLCQLSDLCYPENKSDMASPEKFWCIQQPRNQISSGLFLISRVSCGFIVCVTSPNIYILLNELFFFWKILLCSYALQNRFFHIFFFSNNQTTSFLKGVGGEKKREDYRKHRREIFKNRIVFCWWYAKTHSKLASTLANVLGLFESFVKLLAYQITCSGVLSVNSTCIYSWHFKCKGASMKMIVEQSCPSQ